MTTSLKLGVDVDSASQMVDLATLPLGADLFRRFAVMVRDTALQRQLDKQFEELTEAISASLTSPNVGQLLEVNIYVNDVGNVAIPAGQMVSALGVGLEPLDAMAENLRTPGIRAHDPTLNGLRNASFFIWVTRVGQGLWGQTIPAEFRASLIERGRAEAARRDKLTAWRRAFPSSQQRVIARAKYWTDAEQSRAPQIGSLDTRKLIEKLSQDMVTLENRTNNLLGQYHDLRAAMSRQQHLGNILSTVTALTAIIRAGSEVGKLVCTNDSAIAGLETSPPVATERTVEIWRHETQTTETMHRQVETRITGSRSDMEALEGKLDGLYHDAGIPIPARQPLPPLP